MPRMFPLRQLRRPAAWAVWLLFVSSAALTDLCSGATPDPRLKFFEEQVRPILVEKCQGCHGAEKQKGGLRLDSVEGALAGGDSGPAIDRDRPKESLFLEAIHFRSLEMPPDGKLPPNQLEVLTRWVEMGSPWPAVTAHGVTRGKGEKITAADRAYWAFQPVRAVSLPKLAPDAWCQNPIDAFILDRLRREGLSPSPPAERATLIRRLTFDLTGVPPTPEEVQAFVTDPSPWAYERLVESLLNSPRYGERWARHWLDLVRYAESDGFKADDYRPHAWRYRDYVIHSLNEDKPYREFLAEQLAGDELAPDNLDALAATGYLRHWIYEYNQRDVRTQWANILNDVTDVTAEVFLGLSIGCARCHDHKFDPILRQDYYRLQAFFAPLLPRDDLPFATAKERAAHQAQLVRWEERTANLRQQIRELEADARTAAATAAINKFPPDIRPMLAKGMAERQPFERQLADLAYRQVTAELEKLDFRAKLKGQDKERWLKLQEELAQFEKEKPPALPLAFTVTDVGNLPPPTVIPGDRTKREIPPGFLTVLDDGEARIDPLEGATTGRRAALAQWLTRNDHPLTSRVLVNRVWQYHFGQGIVATPSDFGHLGDTPSHPELLDWLAKWFVDEGWSLKKLHRLLVTSATYRQSARQPAGSRAQLVDPENRWLSHMPIRRLDAEQIRDAALAVSGEISWRAGGPGEATSTPRRTIYTKVLRNQRDPLLDSFDAPDNFNSTATRNVTTTPTQSLLMINGEWLLQRAKTLAARLQTTSSSPAEQVGAAFGLAFGRRPTAEQLAWGVDFLAARDGETPLESGSPGFAPFPGRDGQALDVAAGRGLVPVTESGSPPKAGSTLRVEGYFLLRSLAEDASVRTLISQWDSDQRHEGWSLGVTSTKSRFEPRNLILQFVGATKTGFVYEVVPSNLRVELNRPYFVAVEIHWAETSARGITVQLRELTTGTASTQEVQLSHQVIRWNGPLPQLVLGGRWQTEQHRWDGLLDDWKVEQSDDGTDVPTQGEAKPTPAGSSPSGQRAGRRVSQWLFEPATGVLHDTGLGAGTTPRDLTAAAGNSPTATAPPAALVDFCHVLLNASEFLFVE